MGLWASKYEMMTVEPFALVRLFASTETQDDNTIQNLFEFARLMDPKQIHVVVFEVDANITVESEDLHSLELLIKALRTRGASTCILNPSPAFAEKLKTSSQYDSIEIVTSDDLHRLTLRKPNLLQQRESEYSLISEVICEKMKSTLSRHLQKQQRTNIRKYTSNKHDFDDKAIVSAVCDIKTEIMHVRLWALFDENVSIEHVQKSLKMARELRKTIDKTTISRMFSLEPPEKSENQFSRINTHYYNVSDQLELIQIESAEFTGQFLLSHFRDSWCATSDQGTAAL